MKNRQTISQQSHTVLTQGAEGLALKSGSLQLVGDFVHLLPRVRPDRLGNELLIKASGIMKMHREPGELLALDATAGMGEDAFLLAAAGFRVLLYEKDPVIAALLEDALEKALADERVSVIAGRMQLMKEDSIPAMLQRSDDPEAEKLHMILLDPMFPERTKSALVKKKFQLLHLLEKPCEDEEALLQAAMQASCGRIVIKRPKKGPLLGQIKPSFSMEGKAVRYDCLLPPFHPEEVCKK